MTAIEKLQDRFAGCLLGLAVGDCVGAVNEFKSPGTFKPVDDMLPGGPFNLPVGAFTDDTSMALCLGASLIAKNGFDAADQMERYNRWRVDGYMSSVGRCFDIGGTCSSALNEFRRTGDPYAGSTDPQSCANGSLMRLAPVPIFYFKDGINKASEMAYESSRTTHGSDCCKDACYAMAWLICCAFAGEDKDIMLNPSQLPNYDLEPRIKAVLAGSWRNKRSPYDAQDGRQVIRGTGFVVHSLEAALWAFEGTDNYRDCVLAAANLGDDSDTTAAIAGMLAGAYYGESGIPADWVAKLRGSDAIRTMAYELGKGVL